MVRKASRTGWVWILMFLGLGLLAGAQTTEDADWARAREIFQTLEDSGEAPDSRELVDGWVAALREEFGPKHPVLLMALSASGQAAYEQGAYAEAQRLFEQQVELARKVLGPEDPGTLTALSWLAGMLGKMGDFAAAFELEEEILSVLRRLLGPEHPGTLTAMANLAATLRAQGDFAGARQREEEVLEARRRLLGPEHPKTLTTMANLAATLRAQGDFAGARQREEEVLEALRRLLGPEHPKTLTAMANLAATLRAQGDFAGARQRGEEVLEALRRLLGPEHPDTLTAMANLAGTLRTQGDFAGARQRYKEIVEARRRLLGPEHPDTLTAMANLAGTLRVQGDFARARQREEEVLEALRRLLGPEHPDTLSAVANLASTLHAQGDFAGARQREEEVLEARRRLLGPEHPDTLTVVANLASTLYAQGDFAGARQRYEEVLEARRRLLGPEHLGTLSAVANLASTLHAQGDFAGARQRYEEVLEARRRLLGPEHPDTLKAMYSLASALQKSSDLDGAQRLYEQMFEIQRRTGGLTKGLEAETLFRYAELHRKIGQLDEVSGLYLSALDALEAQSDTFDHSEETKSSFRASKQIVYRVAIDHFLRQGKVNESLHILERYRGQSLLALMRWGRPPGANGRPAEIDTELKHIAQRYDSVTTEMDRLDPATDAQRLTSLRAEQTQLQRRLEVLRGLRIRANSAAATRRLKPLRAVEIQRQLDPGTLLLNYSVGSEGVQLFVLAKDAPPDAHSLPVTQLELWLQWARFFPLLLPTVETEEPESLEETHETADPNARVDLGRWLYDKLLAPAGERLESAKRLLILADGPLHYLPFNALVRPAPDIERGWQYLVEWKPIHVAQSATVYAELQKRRRSSAPNGVPLPQSLVALGNPSYPPKRDDSATEQAAESKDAATRLPFLVRSAKNRGLFDGLTPLPNTQREVTEIGKLFTQAKAEARTYLGLEATEERAKAELAQARYIHLAAHGLADPDVPADSFIALTIPKGLPAGRDNGILQGWEIMDTLHLDADLVVLSACVTALGPNQGGEGLMSLSRAFQIAGARTVAASLWPVADDSTAELMIRFYRHLLAGEPKDEALRAAQMELIAAPIKYTNAKGETVTGDFRAPYHWAAFQLIGDWQ